MKGELEMFRMLRILLSTGALFSLVSCAQQHQAAYIPVASVADIMEGMVAPASDHVFSAVYTEVSEAGIKDIKPQNDEEWNVVAHNAMALVETGNMLKFSPEHKDKADWAQFCQALMDSAMSIVEVAKAHDTEGMLTQGGVMYEACTGCHKVYLPQEPLPEQ
jgi:hypothetical protein